MSTVFGKLALAAKTTELVLACVCIALYEQSLRVPNNLLLPVTFGAYIIILPVLIFGVFIGHRVSKYLDIFWTVTGLTLFIASGSLAIRFHIGVPEAHALTLATGCVAIINAVIFLIDGIMTFKDVHEYNTY